VDWTTDSLKARIKCVLDDLASKAPHVKTFLMDVAVATDSSVSSARNWCNGDNSPDAASLLNLMDNLEGFEGELRGDMAHRAATAERDLAILKDQLRELSNGKCTPERVVPLDMKGKIS